MRPRAIALLAALLAVAVVPNAPLAVAGDSPTDLPAAIGDPLPRGLERTWMEAARRLGRLYDVPPSELARPIRIELADDEPPAGWEDLPSYAAGAARPAAGRIVVLRGRTGRFPFGDTAQTLEHELSHVLLRRGLGFDPPRWLDEGLALRVSGEIGRPDGLEVLRSFGSGWLGAGSLAELEAGFGGSAEEARTSYFLARGFVAELFPELGELPGFIVEARRLGSVSGAVHLRAGRSPEELWDRWRWSTSSLIERVAALGSTGTLFLLASLVALVGFFVVRRRRRREIELLARSDPPPHPLDPD